MSATSADANLRAALTLLEALRHCGLRRLVLCPGSRSAPLAVAAGVLASRGLDLFTAVDERSAAFLALGLGRADGLPAAVVTTSGTAVANLLPAVVEADSGALPLLLLTADRPARLKGCGANQTVNQEAFLAPCCRLMAEGSPAGLARMGEPALRELAASAWRACLGAPPGPVHLNLPFEEPLHVAAAALTAASAAIAANETQGEPPPESPQLRMPAEVAAAWPGLDPDRPGVVVAGPWRGTMAALAPFAEALRRWQRRSGWPVLADALSGLRGWPGLELVHGYDLLLAEGHGLPAAPQLLRLGPMPASRRLQQWIAACCGPQLLITEADPRNRDAGIPATARWPHGLEAGLSLQPGGPASAAAANRALARAWLEADAACQRALDDALETGACTEPGLARRLSRALPPGLAVMLASSSPVRDWESFAAADAPHRPLFGFRGASGIDGTLSLAAGLACSTGALVLLTGDLALLHDANGWLWRHQLEARGARLCVVLVDNGGGGIFEQLPIRLPEGSAVMDFERLFAMPQALDHRQLAAGYGAASRALASLDELEDALAWGLQQPMALLELRTDRRADAETRRQLRRRMAQLSARP
ncbi:MAG: 2-succinyl-5-enolpyruvyl-6-hydroxy-3-cyclohexene-1-carboxylic-acid synthase [Vulcanococcus sp.]